jgi:hypothetical protein
MILDPDDTPTQIDGRPFDVAGLNECEQEDSGRTRSAIREAAPLLSVTRLNSVPETRHGPDVLSVFDGACDWAAIERHALVTVDHLLFALTVSEIAANALHVSGVAAVPDLEMELLNAVHKMPVPALGNGQTQTVDNSMLVIFNHALGYARQNGRNITSLADLLDAVLDALRRSDLDTPGMAALRKRWPKANPRNRHGELLLQIKENQDNQPTMIAKTLAAELAALRERIATLETPQMSEIRPHPLSWYKRLNLFLISTLAAVILSAAGIAPRTGG